MPLDLANMFSGSTTKPKTMTVEAVREADDQRAAKAAAARQALADQEALAARNAERVAAIRQAGIDQHASDIAALAKGSAKAKDVKAPAKKAAKGRTTAPARPAKVAKVAVKDEVAVKAKAAPKPVKRTTPAKVAAANAAPGEAVTVSMVCDVRCGMNGELGRFVGAASSGAILVVMQENPTAAALHWHPSEVVALTGEASRATTVACWDALAPTLDAPLLLVG